MASIDRGHTAFTHKVERLKLQMQSGIPSPQLLQSIAEDVSLLPEIERLVERYPSAKLALSNALGSAEPGQLTRLITDLAPLMKNRRNRAKPIFHSSHFWIERLGTLPSTPHAR